MMSCIVAMYPAHAASLRQFRLDSWLRQLEPQILRPRSATMSKGTDIACMVKALSNPLSSPQIIWYRKRLVSLAFAKMK